MPALNSEPGTCSPGTASCCVDSREWLTLQWSFPAFLQLPFRNTDIDSEEKQEQPGFRTALCVPGGTEAVLCAHWLIGADTASAPVGLVAKVGGEWLCPLLPGCEGRNVLDQCHPSGCLTSLVCLWCPPAKRSYSSLSMNNTNRLDFSRLPKWVLWRDEIMHPRPEQLTQSMGFWGLWGACSPKSGSEAPKHTW